MTGTGSSDGSDAPGISSSIEPPPSRLSACTMSRSDLARNSAVWSSVIPRSVVDSRDRDDESTLYFDGRVKGASMQGEVMRGVGNQQTRHAWRAERVGPVPAAKRGRLASP